MKHLKSLHITDNSLSVVSDMCRFKENVEHPVLSKSFQVKNGKWDCYLEQETVGHCYLASLTMFHESHDHLMFGLGKGKVIHHAGHFSIEVFTNKDELVANLHRFLSDLDAPGKRPEDAIVYLDNYGVSLKVGLTGDLAIESLSVDDKVAAMRILLLPKHIPHALQYDDEDEGNWDFGWDDEGWDDDD